MCLITAAVLLIATGFHSAALPADGGALRTSTSTHETTTTNPYFPKPVPLRSYRDQSYAVAADFGTPPQRLYLTVDVFDTETHVTDAACKECCHRIRYDSSKSNTSKCDAYGRFGTGSESRECTDTLRIGTLFPNLSKDDAKFDDVVLSLDDLNAPWIIAFARVPTDGTVGLGDPDMWNDGWTSDFKWSLYLKSTCTSGVDDNAGTLWVEQLDREHCGAVESVVPIKYDGDAYRVHATLLSVNVPTSTYPLKGIEGRWKAAFSTTSPHIVIPETTFKPLNEIYWHAKEDNETGEWNVDCAYYDATEELQFTFEGNPNASFTFKFGHFIDKVGAKCVLQIRPKRSDDALPERWILGLPFFRKYCALFDVGFGPKNSISFAEQKGYKVPNCTYDAVKTLAPCTPTTTTTTTTMSTPTTTGASSVTYASSALIALLSSIVSLSL